jgi:hypothetical protein
VARSWSDPRWSEAGAAQRAAQLSEPAREGIDRWEWVLRSEGREQSYGFFFFAKLSYGYGMRVAWIKGAVNDIFALCFLCVVRVQEIGGE